MVDAAASNPVQCRFESDQGDQILTLNWRNVMRNIDPNEFGDAFGDADGTPGELPVTPVPAPEKTGMSNFTKLLIGAAVVVLLILIF